MDGITHVGSDATQWGEIYLRSGIIDPANDRVFFGTDTTPGQVIQININQSLLPGDANTDGKVSFADYLILEANFGKSGMMWYQGDFNNDGKVSFADYLLLEANFGKSIPEPMTLVLLGLGGLAMARARK